MKPVFLMILVALLSACATPYYPVYVNNDGDYYITEKANSSSYYLNGASVMGYAGIYPWWEYAYYSPYYFPHYYSVWRPYRYDRWYGWYGAYYPHWCAPYRMPRHRRPAESVDPLYSRVGNPTAPPDAGETLSPTNLTLLRNLDELSLKREQMNRARQGEFHRAYGANRSYKNQASRSSSFTPAYSTKPHSSGISSSRSRSTSSLGRSSYPSNRGRAISRGSRRSGSVRDQ